MAIKGLNMLLKRLVWFLHLLNLMKIFHLSALSKEKRSQLIDAKRIRHSPAASPTHGDTDDESVDDNVTTAQVCHSVWYITGTSKKKKQINVMVENNIPDFNYFTWYNPFCHIALSAAKACYLFFYRQLRICTEHYYVSLRDLMFSITLVFWESLEYL